MIRFSPSLLGADLLHMSEDIRLVEKLGLTWLHVDVMDGHFVPNFSFGPDFVEAIRKCTPLFLDVHLMLSHPMQYIRTFAKAGADSITIHAEAEDDPRKMLEAIAAHGIKAGLSIKPSTDPESIRDLLPLCDMVLVMTVEPGYGGQPLREDCVNKLPVLRQMIRETGREVLLQVDGGVKEENAQHIIEAGADVLVMGTGLFRAKDPARVVRHIRKMAGEK